MSRHHARLIVSGARVTLEDLGSKNGTYLGTRRVTGDTEVRAGDEILVGTIRTRGERIRAGQQLVQHHAEGEDVGPVVERFPLHLLGGHVRGRADARGRRAHAGDRRALSEALGELGHAEVGDLGPAVARDHDVVRLEVAVDDARVVRARQSVRDLRHQLDPRGHAAAFALPLGERLAVDQLHGQEVHVALVAGVVHRHDGRMIERRRRPRLPDEAGHALGIGGAVPRQDLQRDAASQVRVVRAVDLPHAALAEERLDLVAPDAGAGRHGAARGHVHQIYGAVDGKLDNGGLAIIQGAIPCPVS